MDKSKRKNVILFIGSMVVAIMFITSYVAFGSNGPVASTTTVKPHNTSVVFGSANAIVEGYQSSLVVTLKQKNDSSALNQTLSGLEANGLIASYSQETGNIFSIYLAANFSAYQFQQYAANAIPQNALQINATEDVRIPNTLQLYYYGRQLTVYTQITNFTVSGTMLQPVGANVPVKIQALITSNYTVYNSNIQVST